MISNYLSRFLFLPFITFVSISNAHVVIPATTPKIENVTLVGEIHFWTPVKSYEYLLKKFASLHKGRNCLAVEFPESEASFETNLEEFKKRAVMIRENPSPYSMAEAEPIARNFEMVASYYGEINSSAVSNGFRVIAVEHFNKYNEDLDIDERNQAIANNITKALNESACDNILGIFGKVHLSLGMWRTTTIQNLLQAKGVLSTTINLQMTNEEHLDTSMRSFEKSGLTVSGENFLWIKNSNNGTRIMLFPNIPNEGSTWSDFDFTLLIPSSLN